MPKSLPVPASRFYAPANAPSTPKRGQKSLQESTPMTNKASGSHSYASEVKDRVEMNRELSREMKGHFVGAMPVQRFLDTFLNLDQCDEVENEPRPDCSRSAFRRVADSRPETEMYPAFVEAMARFVPGMKFLDTHATGDTDGDRLAPDVSLYNDDDLPDDQSNDRSDYRPNDKTDFSKMSLFVEFKSSATDDMFCDPEPHRIKDKEFNFERDSQESMKYRGQIGSYSAALCGSQFRVHHFSVSICGPTARFIYWDRAGAVVSRSFDYTKNPTHFANFFWRYSHSRPRQQGHDPTITIPSAEEVREAILAFGSQNLRKRGFRKMTVPDRDNPRPELEKPFIIPFPPKLNCRSPFARATRPMFVYDCTSKKVVFLKDYWRPNVEGINKEGDIYAILHKHNVPNIAPFGTGNDVRDHTSLSQNFVEANWACRSSGKEITGLCQYRMTLLVVGWHLTQFLSSKEFIGAIADAMKAHDHAYFDAKILHRDISVGNIIITEDDVGVTHGLLIDWDMCMKADEVNQVKRRSKRTGTWQFISRALLDHPNKRHELEDDRESALYVLLWTAIRYTKSKDSEKDSSGAVELMMAFDEVYADESGSIKGGFRKVAFLTGPTMLDFPDRPQLNSLVKELRTALAVRYEDKPDPKEISELEAFKSEGFPEKLLDKLPASRYNDRMSKLRSRNWLVETIQRHLQVGRWPTDDKAEPQNIFGQSSNKRKRDADHVKLLERVVRSRAHTG